MKITIKRNQILPYEKYLEWKTFAEERGNTVDESDTYIVEIPDEIELKDLEMEYFLSTENGYRFDRQSYQAMKDLKEVEKLRARRAAECFSVIDRSILWHNRLTEEQKTELNVWYQAWLNVTETKGVPEKPAWLEEV